MPWTFAYDSGIYRPDGTFACKAYAGGDLGANPQAIDNPEYEGVKDEGPLPEGLYLFGDPVDHSKLGAFAIPLVPDLGNDMKGRGGFYWHGDTAIPGKASEGCIVSQPDIRHEAAQSDDQMIRVVASYAGSVPNV